MTTVTKKRRHADFVDLVQNELDEQRKDKALVYVGQSLLTRHLESLQYHRHLTRLTLVKCDLTASKLKSVCSARLTYLNVRENPISNAGCDHIATMERLESLNVGKCGISSAGVNLLMSLRRLYSLTIDGNRFSHKGIRYILNRERQFDDLALARKEMATWANDPDPMVDMVIGSQYRDALANSTYKPKVALTRLDVSDMEIPVHLIARLANRKWESFNFTYVDRSMQKLQECLNRNVSESISWTHRLVVQPDMVFETKLDKYNKHHDQYQKMLLFVIGFCLANIASRLQQSIVPIWSYNIYPLYCSSVYFVDVSGKPVVRKLNGFDKLTLSRLVSFCSYIDFRAKK
jgi:hypothetical protein